jgi:hypothetical protein
LLFPARPEGPADGRPQLDETTLLDGQLEEVLGVLEDEPRPRRSR